MDLPVLKSNSIYILLSFFSLTLCSIQKALEYIIESMTIDFIKHSVRSYFRVKGGQV